MESQKCIVILGPTAVGKSEIIYSDLSCYPIQVVSADSMQIYREFDVATATPSQEHLSEISYSAINQRDPSDNYSVSEFLELASEVLEDSRKDGSVPVVAGGTALYIKSFLFGLDDLPSANTDFREEKREVAQEKSSQYLHDELQKIDPEAADNIHPNDTKRIIRALEIYEETGLTKTELTDGKQTIRESIDPLIVGLQRPRHELRERVRNRVDDMIEEGLVSEIKRLREEWDLDKTIKQAIGFESVSDYLDDGISMEEAKGRMVQRTNRLIKKQMNWFRKFPVDYWFHPEHQKKELVETVGQAIKRTSRY